MPEIKVYSQKGKEVGKISLKSKLWEGGIHTHVLHLSLRRQLAGKRAGTHDVKTRGEVSGGGKKPWRQKGTGRARHGSIRSPIWRKGGIIFGPHPRKHGFSLPQQVRQLALESALRNLMNDQKLVVLDKLEIPEGKTKFMAEIFKNLKLEKALILVKHPDKLLERASRNLAGAKVVSLARINVYDLLRFKHVLLTKETFSALEEVFA